MASAQACCGLQVRTSFRLQNRERCSNLLDLQAAIHCQRKVASKRLLDRKNQCRAAQRREEERVERTDKKEGPNAAASLRRRSLTSLVIAVSCLSASPGHARERRQQKVDAAEYSTSSDGLKYYDFVQGKGPEAAKGKKVVVHFDCVYKTLTVVSSREAKLLGGNRVIAQPYEFIAGAKPGAERKRDLVDNANGLFSAQASPKPPPALYTIVEGMKVGGKRTVIVPPEAGYGKKGIGEIPPGATFDLNVELLEVDDVKKDA